MMQPCSLIVKSIPAKTGIYFQIKEKGRLTEKKVCRRLGYKGPKSNRKEENVVLGNEVTNLTFITLIT